LTNNMSLDKLNYLQRWCLTSNRWSCIVRKQRYILNFFRQLIWNFR